MSSGHTFNIFLIALCILGTLNLICATVFHRQQKHLMVINMSLSFVKILECFVEADFADQVDLEI